MTQDSERGPMTGEELRKRIAEAVVQPYPESVFSTVSDEKLGQVADAVEGICTMDALSATTIRACVGPWAGQRIAAAIVEALGITPIMLDDLHNVRHAIKEVGMCNHDSGWDRSLERSERALTTLLDAAGADE